MQIRVMSYLNNKVVKLSLTPATISTVKKLLQQILSESKPKHWFTVLAEGANDIEFVSTNFHNLPLPAAPATSAIWTGDFATFIVANYPK